MNVLFGIIFVVLTVMVVSGQKYESEGQEVVDNNNNRNQNNNGLCPLRCLCFKTTVRCMFLHMEKIPKVPQDTTVLDLRFNRIREIPKNSFIHLPQLTTLLLNNNHLTRLQNGAFNGLDELKYLYLYKNRIRDIDPQVFNDLKNLEQLYLHYNFLTEIHPETFSNLTKLDRLFLHNNKIQRIPYGSFDLRQMKRLRLDSNALVCDCGLIHLVKNIMDHPSTQTAATCEHPGEMQGKPITMLNDMKLSCRSPVITEEPRDIVEVNFGNTVYFSCKAEGDPSPDIIWLHNSNEIIPQKEPRYSVLNDGTLMIANTADKDLGVYECMVKNTNGETKSRKAKMAHNNKKHQLRDGSKVNTRPRFVQVPKDQVVQEGDSATLQCEATGGFARISISWFHNDLPIFSNLRNEISAKGSILIKNVGKKDEGIYRCTATNSYAKVSAIAELKILVPPFWITTPFDQTIRIGSSLQLKCEAGGKPLPSITWTRNSIPINFKDSNLLIRVVTQEDEGEYICKVRNSMGELEQAANVRIIRGSPPVFSHESPDFISVSPGNSLQLPCSASADPPAQIIWKRNGINLLENSKITILPRGTLILNQFNPVEDTGVVYECSAFNDHGLIKSDPYRILSNGAERIIQAQLDINQVGSISGNTLLQSGNSERGNIEDSFLLNAISQARLDVSKAENDSIQILFGNITGIKNPGDLIRLARFPKLEGRNIARAAEIYERTLQIISKHIEEGMNFSLSGDFSYKDILSPAQLEILGRFSGCIGHRKPKSNCSVEMCFHKKYRSIDGSCNNLQEPMYGNSYTPFQRLLPSVYENGFNLPLGWTPGLTYNGHEKPSARLVSIKIVNTENITPDTTYTHMVMQWGQFLDHDLDHALPSLSIESFGERISCRRTCENVAPCFPIKAPDGDPRIRTRKCIEFTRSAAVCGSGMSSILFDTVQKREQINQLTSFIDASQVYGSSEDELRELRDRDKSGFLRSGIYIAEKKPLMPFAIDGNPVDCRRDFRESDVGCFLGGDIRANEQLGLLAMHTIFFRQHNFIAGKLSELNPNIDQEILFQETRKIVGAQNQHITYAHWLPFIVGKKGMDSLGPYTGYKPEVNPTITTEFATAAMRFGHTMINPVLRRLDSNFQTIREGDLPLRHAFFAPWRLVEEGGIDPLLRGLFTSSAKLRKSKELLNSHLINDLFSTAHLIALDLGALNIQRGRDHGLNSYNDLRHYCNLTRAKTFDDLKVEITDLELLAKLEEVYKHVDNIDLWVGGISEEPSADARVGPTFSCILVDQFRRLRDGDRFWYENPSVFKPEQLTQIKQSSLARIICDNSDKITHIKRDVFHMESPLIRCDHIPHVHFGMWANECCTSEGEKTCPYLNHNQRNNLENNQIQRRRRRYTTNTIYANDTLIKHENENLTGNGNEFERTLLDVKSTVSALEKKIKELEKNCKKVQNTSISQTSNLDINMSRIDEIKAR